MDKEDWKNLVGGVGLVLILVLFFVLLTWAALQDEARSKTTHYRLMEQCMQDHKEYDCVRRVP